MFPFNSARFGSSAALCAAAAGGSSVIKMIQQGTATVASGATTGTYTISPAITTVGNAILIWNGTNVNDTTGVDQRDDVTITLTNSTTVTVTRGVSLAFTVTAAFTIVEFASGVNSIQAGNIAVATSTTSNTATISAVGANAFVLYQGMNVSGTTTSVFAQSGVQLTNSTTVTAFVPSSATITQTVRYMVVDLDTTVVSAVQQVANADTSAGTSTTDTITSVTTGNASLMWGGVVQASGVVAGDGYNLFLTNGTTVTKTRTGISATSRTVYYTVVTWAASALNGSVQRTNSALAMAAATSATWTLGSSVATAKSFVNYGGFSAPSSTNASTFLSTLTLSSTTVVAVVTNAGTSTPAAEVVQFA